MALETGTYISDLVATNPVASDAVAQAQGHLTLIKSTLKNTFPNVKGAVSATHENLSNGTPVGLIAMWSGSSIPAGWALCNGVAVNRSDGTGQITPPDLRDRFIVGAGLSYTTGNTGGNAQISLSVSQLPSHNHTASTDVQGVHSHVLHDNHTHPFTVVAQNVDSNGSGALTGGSANTGNDGTYNGTTGVSSGGITMDTAGGHGHNITIGNTGSGASIDIRNPYYALALIMKV
ncbi:tail fiber protein [Burkholderia vietnamiensis]|uniref:tail fiber protein n=1 Tax=Burkholderia vietnamiensis TaxID=60552 RepID=UPI002654974F|nr:tail fiber protein [Burkholderia vietnamiensis]MDN8037455.1 tail fiber protein [Burkholderia vietnamiensis]